MKKLFYIIIIALITLSCEKSKIDVLGKNGNALSTIDKIKVIEGRLVFQNYQDFNQTINYLFINQNQIKDFESQFKGFTSNKQAFEKIDSSYLAKINYDFSKIGDFAFIQKINNEKSLERVIDLPLLSYVFNDKGIVQIGDSIFKFTYEFTYKFNVAKLNQFKSSKSYNDQDGVSAYPNIRKRYEIEPRLKSTKASLSEVTNYYTSKKFLKAEINENNTVIHVAVTVDTKSRRKIAGIGFAYNVEELYVAGEGWIGYNYPPNPDLYPPVYKSVSDMKFNGTDVQETLEWGAGTPGAFPAPYLISGHGTHWLKETSSSGTVSANTSYNE